MESAAESANEDPMEITGAPLEARPDCTLACDKGHITAHKLVLCDHSKYLQDILSKFPTADHPIIVLTELNIIDIKILVNYMYTGELVITSDSSPSSLLRAAQILKIDSLTADDDDELDGVVNHEDDDLDQDVMREMNGYDEEDDYDDDLDDEDDEDALNVDHPISIKNIYSLNQPIDATSPPPPPSHQHLLLHHQQHQNNSSNNHNNLHQLPLSSGSMPGSNNTTTTSNASSNFIDSEFSSNPKLNNNHLSFSNNNTPNSLSHHIQQQLSSHLDLQDLQDSKHIDSKNNKIRCHLCNIGLSDVKCLYRHVLTRHLPEKWGYKCEFCDREFSRDDHLMRHYTTKHKNMEFNREKIRETRRLNREMAKNFHDQISTV